MGRGKPVVLDTMSFSNQSQALEHFKVMLNRYIPGERVSDEDTPALASLFKRHPDYLEKLGVGISHFEVMPGDYGSQCFCIVRIDGTKEDFSYKRSVTQKRD